MKKKILALVAVFVLVSFTSAFARLDWMLDFDKAYAKAQKENKPLMILFTGSDWCSWCIKLDKEILSKSEFDKYAKANLVLLYCDFPNQKKISKSQTEHNKKLADEYGIRGYPTVVVLGKEKTQSTRLGYQKGGPKGFIEKLDEFKTKNFPVPASTPSSK